MPAITVTPMKLNTQLEDLRATVDRRAGVGRPGPLVRVTPEGTIALPAIGYVRAQGLTLRVATGVNERYRETIEASKSFPC